MLRILAYMVGATLAVLACLALSDVSADAPPAAASAGFSADYVDQVRAAAYRKGQFDGAAAERATVLHCPSVTFDDGRYAYHVDGRWWRYCDGHVEAFFDDTTAAWTSWRPPPADAAQAAATVSLEQRAAATSSCASGACATGTCRRWRGS